MVANWFFWVFVLFYVAYLVVEIGLDLLNVRYINSHAGTIPALFRGVYSPEDYQKSIAYTKAKTSYKICELVIDLLFSICVDLDRFFWLARCVARHFYHATVCTRCHLSVCSGCSFLCLQYSHVLLLPIRA